MRKLFPTFCYNDFLVGAVISIRVHDERFCVIKQFGAAIEQLPVLLVQIALDRGSLGDRQRAVVKEEFSDVSVNETLGIRRFTAVGIMPGTKNKLIEMDQRILTVT